MKNVVGLRFRSGTSSSSGISATLPVHRGLPSRRSANPLNGPALRNALRSLVGSAAHEKRVAITSA